jgi:hypothetical protein
LIEAPDLSMGDIGFVGVGDLGSDLGVGVTEASLDVTLSLLEA